MRFAHNTYYLIHNTQLGFAPIALVVLLLFGIAAGTLLVQNGVNFIPKAADEIMQCDKTYNTIQNCNKPSGRCTYTFSHCDITDADRRSGIQKEQNLAKCIESLRSTISAFYCKIEDAAYAGGCTQDQINKNPNKDASGKPGGCYLNSKSEPVYLYPDKSDCPAASIKTCKDWGLTKENGEGNCKIVRGEIRCIYRDKDTECHEKDKGPAGTTCKIITRDNLKISDYTQKCNDGWSNFCRIVMNKGCADKPDGVPDCEGSPTPITPPAAQPRVNPPPPAPGADPPRTGAPPATGGQPPAPPPATVATGCEEFKDGQSLSIPCFKIGVFSPEELAAIEADAKEAVKRYLQFQDILTKIGDKISKEITDNAQAKLKTAKANADECIAGK